jgi:hypothetical protein
MSTITTENDVVASITTFTVDPERQRDHRPQPGTLWSCTLALMLLSWPVLWIAVGYVRYALTGKSLGS